MKSFIVTVDTEGDNLWGKTNNDIVETKNSVYIPRFQELCEKYDMKPTYLVNYEMANDSRFVDYISKKYIEKKCEIGMHLHAWNMPGWQSLNIRQDIKPGKPFLIEYPEEYIEEKISIMTDLLYHRFGVKPQSHRAGRWATNDIYFKYLHKYGYLVDCSVTPHIDWSKLNGFTQGGFGIDYREFSEKPSILLGKGDNALWEVPMTIIHRLRYDYSLRNNSIKELKHYIRCRFIGCTEWFRILDNSINAQKIILKKSKSDYVMFMLHSSELMPGGSRYFKSNKDVTVFLENIENLFRDGRNLGYCGITLLDYRKSFDR